MLSFDCSICDTSSYSLSSGEIPSITGFGWRRRPKGEGFWVKHARGDHVHMHRCSTGVMDWMKAGEQGTPAKRQLEFGSG